jgi:hypothetical protein
MFGCSKSKELTIYFVGLKSWPANSQFKKDAVKLDRGHNQALLENDRVRVVRLQFGPGESGPIVDKRPRVIILLTDMHAVVTFPDGHSEPRDGAAGTVSFGSAGSQATKNVGDKTFINIVVELKPRPR